MNITLATVHEHFRSMRHSTLLALVALAGLFAMYVLVEPTVSRSQAFDQFIITQTVTAEIAFLAATNDVTMDTSIPGITGGTANGATQVRVYTNNVEGYSMTMRASSSPAMQGNTQGGSIRDFSTTTSGWMAEPSYDFTVPANSAGFGYTVKASTTGEVDPSFRDNGSICNTGANESAGQCWIGASTTAYTIVNRATETTASGATTTIFFRTTIQSNPSPSIPEDTYVATTTLTATAN
jgi:hypothetical protein